MSVKKNSLVSIMFLAYSCSFSSSSFVSSGVHGVIETIKNRDILRSNNCLPRKSLFYLIFLLIKSLYIGHILDKVSCKYLFSWKSLGLGEMFV